MRLSGIAWPIRKKEAAFRPRPLCTRLYFNADERAAFLAAARRQPARDRTICETLHHTGCRPSELMEITPARVDLSGGTVAIRSLNERKDAARR